MPAHKRRHILLNAVHVLRAQNAAWAGVKQVVNVGNWRALGVRQHLGSGRVRQIQRVQHLTGHFRLELLNVADRLGNTHAVPAVCHKDGRCGSYGDVALFLIFEDFVFQAVDTAALCNAVAVIVHQHVFNAQITLGQRVIFRTYIGVVFVGIAVLTQARRTERRVCGLARVVRATQVLGSHIRVAHLNQIGKRHAHDTGHIWAVLQKRLCPITLDQQVLWRERFDANVLA